MSPRPGGESDKLGNKYEAAWTVHHVLLILADRAKAITVEALGGEGWKVEFVLEPNSGCTQVHQLKRQRARASEWTAGDLHGEDLFAAAKDHVAAGRNFHFVSMVPAPMVKEVAHRARFSDSLEKFLDSFTPGDRILQTFEYLDKKIGSPADAWTTLRGFYTHCIDDEFLVKQNAALAQYIFDTGAPATIAPTLRDLIEDHLAVRLDKSAITALLPDYDLKLADLAAIRDRFHASIPTIFDRWRASVHSELIDPHIDRAEVADVESRLRARGGVFFIAGDGGTGKSGVLHDVAESLRASGWHGAAFRIDREQPFSSTHELGSRHGLGASPVAALGTLAGDEPSFLVIDQLDAVSLASGRMPETFYSIEDMVMEASAFDEMRVIVACRKFDLENDSRIRTLLKRPGVEQIDLRPLTAEQVRSCVAGMGLPAKSLTEAQVKLLSAPFPLKLLSETRDRDAALAFTTLQDLQEAFWEAKSQACDAHRGQRVRFGQVVKRLATLMSERQRLTLPWTVLDEDDLSADARVMVSEHVLARDGRDVGFFHESFFDYAFARLWAESGQSLVEFLTSGEQELFRRSQLRQILVHLRLVDSGRFCEEVERTLASLDVRFHLKHVAIAVLRSLDEPSSIEWVAIQRLIQSQPDLSPHLWQALRTPAWFHRADVEGALTEWLASVSTEHQSRALEIMVSGVREFPDRVAELLAPHAGTVPDYGSWLQWVLRPAVVHSSRPLFDLLLDSVRRGEYDGHEHALFMSAYNLADHEGSWAVELVQAYWSDRPGAISEDVTQPIPALDLQDHSALELIAKSAKQAPEEFAERMVPYLVKVFEREVSAQPEGRQRAKSYFTYLRIRSEHLLDAEDAVIAATADSLRAVVAQATDVPDVVQQLAQVNYPAAHSLVNQALSATGSPVVAEYAAARLLEGADGFLACHDSWVVRELVVAISPLVTSETLGRLEAAVLALHPEWERRRPGAMTHTILAGMPGELLSAAARRRLGELERLYGQPEPPGKITAGFVPSPIPESAVQHMTDTNWIQAIEEYRDEERSPWEFKGGAHELASMLNEATKKDPARYAVLALRLNASHHPAYGSAILRGLGEAQADIDPALVFEAALHLGTLGHPDVDRWIAWSVRQHLKGELPDPLVELLVDRMLNSPDPGEDEWPDDNQNSDLERDHLLTRGINCVRGHTAELLGDYLVYDADGGRTSHVVPVLPRIAAERSAAVKSCSARLLAACLRHAEADAMSSIVEFLDADDRLLASHHVQNLLIYASYRDLGLVEGQVSRLIESDHTMARRAGGQLAAFIGLEHGRFEAMRRASTSADADVRRGVAAVAAIKLARGSRTPENHALLVELFSDSDAQVREEAAKVGMHLREHALRPFADTLAALIASPSFRASIPQLFLTLQYAPDRVQDLILAAARRFLDEVGTEAGDMRTSAAGDAHYVGELVLRAFAQAGDASQRKEALDLIDGLLRVGAYGIEDLLDKSDRTV